MTTPTTPTTGGVWSFNRSNEWVSKYSACNKNAERISPLNIDTSNIAPCNALCRLSVNYKPTTCSVSMINNIPTVTFSPNCILKFKNDFFFLRKMTIHYTSMHTVNTAYNDLEILLYHNRNAINDSDGGIILSIMMRGGKDFGSANSFFNEFINQMPSNEVLIEKDIDVSSTWCPDQLFPEDSKAFYYYDGALPYPPCTPNWTFIIFEEAVQISKNIINTVKYMLGAGINNVLNKNIRPIQKKPQGIVIFYNSNSQFDGTQDISDTAVSQAISPISTVAPINSLGSTSWLKQNIYFIKGIVITIVLLLMVYTAIKFAKIIVQNDLLNSFIIRQLQKSQHLKFQKSQEKMAEAEAAQYGQNAPVADVAINDNNNNNNNNN